MLDVRDKVGIARGLMEFLRGYPERDDEGFDAWLKRTGQTERAIRHFWQPVVVGALNDGFARCSTKYAGKVFHETFLKSARGGRLGIPAAPLSEFLAPVLAMVERAGVEVRTKCGVEGLRELGGGRWEVRVEGGLLECDAVVLATNFKETAALVPGAARSWSGLFRRRLRRFILWFDREVSEAGPCGAAGYGHRVDVSQVADTPVGEAERGATWS